MLVNTKYYYKRGVALSSLAVWLAVLWVIGLYPTSSKATWYFYFCVQKDARENPTSYIPFPPPIITQQDATAAGGELCGGGLLASSISSSISALIDGDETAAIFKKDVGELMVRPVTPGSARKKN